ncbi:F-box/LRR-repeat protein At2g29930-like isoform X2 [Herrania umbratica]|uniref:F-box/LRR-repeat protein At2g29930-like isoform X2 n=1 Tax=Herrania umbratica TaxID=108875 RepID=A0A6J1A3W0_9ROSI|nr:F-box/LRR-repeat protein At2g29930-like isoform X2 [Herrania umbratica]
MDQRGPFALPRYLVAPDSLEILELDLQGSVLKIPSDVGFSRLKSLQLVRTQLLDQNLFHNFVSSCPLLENLSLEGCLFYDFKVLDISLRNLRILFVDNDMGGGPFDERLWECVLKIACPNLAYFHLSDPFAQNFSWDKIPSLLQTATIWPWWWEDALIREELANYLLKLLRGVCHAEVLKLGKYILQVRIDLFLIPLELYVFKINLFPALQIAGSSLPRSDLHDREWVEQRVIFTQ